MLLKQNLYSAPKPVTGKARPFLDTTPFAASSAARSRASCSSQKGSSYFPALLSRQVFANCLGDLQVLRTFAPLQPQKFRKNKFIKPFGGPCFLKSRLRIGQDAVRTLLDNFFRPHGASRTIFFLPWSPLGAPLGPTSVGLDPLLDPSRPPRAEILGKWLPKSSNMLVFCNIRNKAHARLFFVFERAYFLYRMSAHIV